MTGFLTFDSWDSPQREPPEPPPPYRDGAQITECSQPFGWTCPCGDVCDQQHRSESGARLCLLHHLDEEHGEALP